MSYNRDPSSTRTWICSKTINLSKTDLYKFFTYKNNMNYSKWNVFSGLQIMYISKRSLCSKYQQKSRPYIMYIILTNRHCAID